MLFLDRAWWGWDGWTGVLALAQTLAAFATLGTLIFFWLQIRREHTDRQADRDHSLRLLHEGFQTTNTPVLTVVVRGGQAAAENGSATFGLVAQGNGVVRNIEIDCWVGNTEPLHPLARIAAQPVARGEFPRLALVRTAPALVAPGELEFACTWHAWHEPQRLTIRVRGFGTFGQDVSFEQLGEIPPNGFVSLASQTHPIPVD